MKNYIIKKSVAVFLVSTLILSSIFSANAENMDVYNKLSYDDVVTAMASVGNNISYSTDFEGNIYGPEDFCLDANNAYILNSVNNSIIKFTNGIVDKIIELKEIPSLKIAAMYGNLYVLDTNLNISTFSSKGEYIHSTSNKNIQCEAILDFAAYDNYIYVTTAEGDSGKTYKICVDDNGIPNDKIEIWEGMILDSHTVYIVELLAEPESSIGHSCRIVTTDTNSGEKNEVVIAADYLIAGAQLLGIDYNNRKLVIRLIELVNNPDFTFACEETIRIIDFKGNLEAVRSLNLQEKYISKQTKVFNSEIFVLNNDVKKVGVYKLEMPSKESVKTFVSRLSAIDESKRLSSSIKLNEIFDAQNQPSEILSGLTRAAISRNTIITNAQTYHTSFSWSCVADNYASMTNYTKPHQLTAPGTYTCMPYCWGGFDSTSQFVTGLASGSGSTRGRAGNINTSPSSKVPGTYGLDCSGYVSRAWGLTTKYGTSTIGSVATAISASQLLKGDALNKSGDHIVLYEKTSGSDYVLYECTLLNNYDRVAYTTRSITSLQSYTPIRYNDVI